MGRWHFPFSIFHFPFSIFHLLFWEEVLEVSRSSAGKIKN
jgi:hypothetical protein